MTLDPNWGRKLAPNPSVHQEPPRAGGDLRAPFTHQELIEIGKQAVEQFLRRVALAILNQIPLGGEAFTLISEWADQLDSRVQSFLGAFDGIDLSGDPGAILRAIVEAIAGAVADLLSIDRLEALIFGGDDDDDGMPMDMPADLSSGDPLRRLFGFLRLLAPFDPSDASVVIGTDTLRDLITGKLRPLGMLAEITGFGGRLLNSQAPQSFVDLVDDLIAVPGDVIGELTDVIIDPIGTTVQGFFNFLRNAFDGSTFTDSTAAEVAEAAAGIAASVAAANAALAAFQAGQAGGGASGGMSRVVNVGEHADGAVPSVFSLVETSGAGSVVVSNGRLVWVDSGSSSAVRKYIHDDELLTDFFMTQMVMPARGEGPLFFDEGHNYLIGRSNSAGSRYCDAQVGYSTIRIGCVVDGTRTWFDTATPHNTTAGALVTFIGGTLGGDRIFEVWVNNQRVVVDTDTGAVSYLGALYRRCGVGFGATARFGGGQSTPAPVSTWTMADNVPPDIVGTGLEVYRAATGSVNLTTGGTPAPVACPSGTFDTVANAKNVGWDGEVAEIQERGRYQVSFRLNVTTDLNGGESAYPALMVNGAARRLGGGVSSPGVVTISDEFGITFGCPIHLDVGDEICPGGYRDVSSSSLAVVGDTDGMKTWFSIAKLS